MDVKYSYDEKCFDLARHFYPLQSFAFLEALAQEIQDCVEGREEIPPEPVPRYQCMVAGCPANHVSKRDVCSAVETDVVPHPDADKSSVPHPAENTKTAPEQPVIQARFCDYKGELVRRSDGAMVCPECGNGP